MLVGDQDGVTPPEHAREMAEAIPDAHLVIVPDAGHISTLEQPDAVTTALLEWLEA
ncbi:MAG: alpha/beta hydrolase [Brevundimonas sp.]|nr:alpha/beta hydrolase [Brevundimonas sp.]